MKHRIAADILSPFSALVESGVAWLLLFVKSTTLLSFYEGDVFRKGKRLSLGRVLGVIPAMAGIMLISEVGPNQLLRWQEVFLERFWQCLECPFSSSMHWSRKHFWFAIFIQSHCFEFFISSIGIVDVVRKISTV